MHKPRHGVLALQATAAAITLGTGNSLGPEGPSVDIGRAAARGLGNVLKSKQRRLLALVAAGSGAGKLLTHSLWSCTPAALSKRYLSSLWVSFPFSALFADVCKAALAVASALLSGRCQHKLLLQAGSDMCWLISRSAIP